jgi:ankyrin repeat protein
MWAAYKGHLETVRVLLEFGVDVNLQTKVSNLIAGNSNSMLALKVVIEGIIIGWRYCLDERCG